MTNNLFLFSEWRIQDGWMDVIMRQGKKTLWISYDECLSDAPVGFVEMYQKVLHGEDYTFSEWVHEGSLIFASRMIGKDTVKLIVSCTYDKHYCTTDWENEWKILAQDKTQGIIFYETYAKEEFLQLLDAWFQALLHHPDFPFQYPCFHMLDDTSYEKALNKATQLTTECVNEECWLIENKLVRENVPLTEEGNVFYEKYKRMLRDHIVPDGWNP